MKKCPICELNYVDDEQESCKICNSQSNTNLSGKKVDSNKAEVEKYLLPFLRSLQQKELDLFLQKEKSFELFKLRLPLLIRCKNIDKEHCKKETIVDNSTTSRYYVTPYYINGNYYHICSQWWNFGTEYSKAILQLLKNVNI